jgi:3-hydroxybutyrate dehydrogenase
MSLVGKRALVTGGSSGIGRAISRHLAREGAEVTVTCTPPEYARAPQPKDVARPKRSVFLQELTDLSSSAGARDIEHSARIADFCSESLPSVVAKLCPRDEAAFDILVNNAGFQHVGSPEYFADSLLGKGKAPPTIVADMLQAMLTVPLVLAHEVIARWQTEQRELGPGGAPRYGRVLNIGSVHGLVASASKSPYVSAKHGLAGATKALALDTAPTMPGVSVVMIAPGWVETPLVLAQIAARAEAEGISEADARRLLIEEKQPSGRFVSPDDIGELVTFLARESAVSMTGQSITLDGGWTSQ